MPVATPRAYPALKHVIHSRPAIPIRQGRLVPGGGAQLMQFLKAVTGNGHMDSPGDPAQHGARSDAHGCPVGVISR